MIRLILARHGNTFEPGAVAVQIGVRTDVPLTEVGRRQAERIGQYLMAERIYPKVVYSGSLKRQRESAQIVAERFGLGVLEETVLNEIDYGLWEGLSPQQIVAQWPNEYRDWTERAVWPGSIFRGTEMGHREGLDRWFAELRTAHAGSAVLAFTSGGCLRLLNNSRVNTGCFCEMRLLPEELQIGAWNRDPAECKAPHILPSTSG